MSIETAFTFGNLLSCAIDMHWWHSCVKARSNTQKGFQKHTDTWFIKNIFDKTEPGKLDVRVLREIMNDYSVIRGVSEPEKNVRHLAEALLALMGSWPESLDKRGQLLAATARKLEKKGHTRYKLYSGLSKLVWFVKPDDHWTMLDKFAFAAIAPKKPRGSDQAPIELFYSRLEALEFKDCCEKTRSVLKMYDANFLYPGRIFDKAFWILGNNTNYKLVADYQSGANRLCASEKVCELVPKIAHAIEKKLMFEDNAKLLGHLSDRFGLQKSTCLR